jgi:hypothetical protein
LRPPAETVKPRTRLQRLGRGHVGTGGDATSPAPSTAEGRARRNFCLQAVAALALCAAATPGWAKPRTSVIPFGRHEVERQLRRALCAEVTCVNPGEVTTKGRLDFKKVSAEELTGVVTGKLATDAKTHKRLVDIEVLAPSRVILVRKKVPLQGTALSEASLNALKTELVGVLNRAHGPGEAVPPRPPAPAAAPPNVEGAPPTVAAAGAAAAAPTPAAAAPAAEAASEASPQAEEGWPPLLEVQFTFTFFNRQYTYAANASPGTPLLRNSTVPFGYEPSLLVGVYPLRAPEGFFAALGFTVGAATSVGMEIQRQSDGKVFPAVSVAANAGLELKLRLGKTVLLSPVVGWQLMDFDVHPAVDGTPNTAQPAVHWRAIRGGLKLEVAFNAWCILFFEGSYLYTYSVGPLAKYTTGPNPPAPLPPNTPYFTGSSGAPSFDSALGLGFQVSPRLQLRVGFLLTLYGMNFQKGLTTSPASVTDQNVGGTLGVRYTF